MRILIDADGCPVKAETIRVAKRYGLRVVMVANAWMRTGSDERVTLEVVGEGLNAADDWIAEHAGENDIVITADVPLAARCVAKGAAVLDHRGGAFTEERVKSALAGRDLLSHLREAGVITGGPPPLDRRERSRFLQRLDETVHAVRRRRARRQP